jgi:VanZ family protein
VGSSTTSRHVIPGARILAWLCLIVASGILVCTLWPFDAFPPNRVSWLEQSNGLCFRQRGVVLSHAEPAQSPASSTPCTLELWIRPAQTNSVFTILNIYDPANPYRFLIRQYLVGLIISHDVALPHRKSARIKVDVNNGLQEKQLSFLTITSGSNGTSVYFDGTLKKYFPHFQISYQDIAGQIVLGSSTVQPDAWPGEVHGLALYSRELNPQEVNRSYREWSERERGNALISNEATSKYIFDEGAGIIVHDVGRSRKDLFIPKTYEVPHHSFLTPPWREFEPTWDYFWDVLRNIVGFMPFGFIICALLSRSVRVARAVLYSTLLGALLSFSIELMQAYIPQRASGITDIMTNTLGAFLGALLLRSQMVSQITEGLVARFAAKASASRCSF